MARTTIPELTAERIANRLSLLLGRPDSPVAQGNIDSIIWTLAAVGFDREILSGLLADAAGLSETDPADVLGKYLPAERSTKRSKSHVSG